MSSDPDIYRTAKALIDRYGDAASLHAAIRADEILEKGDLDGWAVWLSVHGAVLTLLKNAPDEGQATR